jgi:hypothetical protein
VERVLRHEVSFAYGLATDLHGQKAIYHEEHEGHEEVNVKSVKRLTAKGHEAKIIGH